MNFTFGLCFIKFNTMKDNNYQLFSIQNPLYKPKGVFETNKEISNELHDDPVTKIMETFKFKNNVVQAGQYVSTLLDPSIDEFTNDTAQELFVFGSAREVRSTTRALVDTIKMYMNSEDIGYVVRYPDSSSSDKTILSIVFHCSKWYLPIVIVPTRCNDMYSVLNTMQTTAEQALISYHSSVPKVLVTKRFIDSIRTRKLSLTHNSTTTNLDIAQVSRIVVIHDLCLPKKFDYQLTIPTNEDFSYHPKIGASFNTNESNIRMKWPDAHYELFFHEGNQTSEIYQKIRMYLTREQRIPISAFESVTPIPIWDTLSDSYIPISSSPCTLPPIGYEQTKLQRIADSTFSDDDFPDPYEAPLN